MAEVARTRIVNVRLKDRASRALTTRRYEAASAGRRWGNTSLMVDQRSAALAAVRGLRQKARSAVANVPLGASIADGWQSVIAGSGFKPQSLHPDAAVRADLNLRFESWTDRADQDRIADFQTMQGIVARRMVIDGESLVLKGVDPDTGELRLRITDADHLDPWFDRDIDGGRRVVSGVEFDAAGARVAYWLNRDPLSIDRVRVPVEDICHVYRVEFANQCRGLSWLAAILLRLADLDRCVDAQVVRQQIAAMLAGFIVSPQGEVPQFEGSAVPLSSDSILAGLEPGTLKTLGPGEDVKFSTPADLGAESIEFLRLSIREIASGCGLPYSMLSGDLSDTNYSSARVALVEFRRRAEALQYATLVFQFCRRVWARWVTLEALAGRIDADAFAANPAAYTSAKWLAPKQMWVDPLKDAQGEREAIAAGLMSRREAVASRGWDIEQLDQEIAADRERERSLGLDFTAAPAPAAQGTPQ